MKAERLFQELSHHWSDPGGRAGTGDGGMPEEGTLYVERSGDEFSWRVIPFGAPLEPPSGAGEKHPDAWIFRIGEVPAGGPETSRKFFDELIAEMETMAAGPDRCRWPLDQPWPDVP